MDTQEEEVTQERGREKVLINETETDGTRMIRIIDGTRKIVIKTAVVEMIIAVTGEIVKRETISIDLGTREINTIGDQVEIAPVIDQKENASSLRFCIRFQLHICSDHLFFASNNLYFFRLNVKIL